MGKKLYMHSAHMQILWFAYMRFADIPKSYEYTASEDRRQILAEFGLKEGRTERRILIELSKIGFENVYQLSKRMRNIGHYSTVLRALRRLEKEKLVKVVPSDAKRNSKFYMVTQLGELITDLVEGGWKAAANTLAERSSSFRDLIKVHRPLRSPTGRGLIGFGLCYYWSLTRDVIGGLQEYRKFKNLQPPLESIVRQIEYDWIGETLTQAVHDPSSRREIAEYLKRSAHIAWIRSTTRSFVEEWMDEEKEWLQGLDELKRGLVSAEKNAKLSQFANDLDKSEPK